MLNNEVKVLLFEALSCDVPPYYLGGKIVLPVKVIVMRRVHLSKIKKKKFNTYLAFVSLKGKNKIIMSFLF